MLQAPFTSGRKMILSTAQHILRNNIPSNYLHRYQFTYRRISQCTPENTFRGVFQWIYTLNYSDGYRRFSGYEVTVYKKAVAIIHRIQSKG